MPFYPMWSWEFSSQSISNEPVENYFRTFKNKLSHEHDEIRNYLMTQKDSSETACIEFLKAYENQKKSVTQPKKPGRKRILPVDLSEEAWKRKRIRQKSSITSSPVYNVNMNRQFGNKLQDSVEKLKKKWKNTPQKRTSFSEKRKLKSESKGSVNQDTKAGGNPISLIEEFSDGENKNLERMDVDTSAKFQFANSGKLGERDYKRSLEDSTEKMRTLQLNNSASRKRLEFENIHSSSEKIDTEGLGVYQGLQEYLATYRDIKDCGADKTDLFEGKTSTFIQLIARIPREAKQEDNGPSTTMDKSGSSDSDVVEIATGEKATFKRILVKQFVDPTEDDVKFKEKKRYWTSLCNKSYAGQDKETRLCSLELDDLANSARYWNKDQSEISIPDTADLTSLNSPAELESDKLVAVVNPNLNLDGPENHWLCLYKNGDTISIYDSLLRERPTQMLENFLGPKYKLRRIINRLGIAKKRKVYKIHYYSCGHQTADDYSCGYYAHLYRASVLLGDIDKFREKKVELLSSTTVEKFKDFALDKTPDLKKMRDEACIQGCDRRHEQKASKIMICDEQL